MFPSVIFFIIFMYVLFVALTPGVLLTLPPNSPVNIVAFVHGLVFIIVGVLTTMLLVKFSNRREGGGNHGIPSPSQQIINNNINKQEYDSRKISNEKDKISNEAMIKQLNESIKYYDDMKKKEMSNTTSVVKGSGMNANIFEYDLKIQQAEEDISVYTRKIQMNDSIINQPLQNVVY